MKRVPVSKSSAELFTHISKKTKTEGSLIAMGTLAGVKPDDVYKRVVDFEKLHDDKFSNGKRLAKVLEFKDETEQSVSEGEL